MSENISGERLLLSERAASSLIYELASMRSLERERERLRERVLSTCEYMSTLERAIMRELARGNNKRARVYLSDCMSLIPYCESESLSACFFGLLSSRELALLRSAIDERARSLFMLSARERASASAYFFKRARAASMARDESGERSAKKRESGEL